jgi:hypothetical protein
MKPTLGAGGAGVVGGLVWIIGALISWGDDVGAALYALGLALALLALAGLGYTLVDHAPVWLRGVVCVATPALGYMVWVAVSDAFDTDAAPVLAAGLLLLAAGAVTVARHRDAFASRHDRAGAAPAHSRRAAR